MIDDRSDNGYGNSDSGSDTEGGSKKRKSTPAGGDAEPRKTKRRKLERKSKPAKENSKFKSSELVVDSDSDEEAVQEATTNDVDNEENAELDEQLDIMSDDDGADAVATQPRRKKRAVVDDDEEEEDVPMVDENTTAAGNENALGQ